jgi:hypothetical protein
MKKLLLITLVFTSFYALKAQTPDSLAVIARQIVDEATLMYKSEMASWYATDLLLDKYKEKVEKSAGYFSYSENGIDKCIFYSEGDAPKVLATIEFNGVYSLKAAKDDPNERDFTELEKQYYTMRALATKRLRSDTLFKSYDDTDLNLIPIIRGNQRKVYILTGPQKKGVIILGNDYELNFDKKNAITSVKKIHHSILNFNFSKDDKNTVGATHTHLESTGDFITVTDVCTLMLYAKAAKWQQHLVISEKYVSIWTAEKNNVVIISRDTWDSINSDKEKSKKKKTKD